MIGDVKRGNAAGAGLNHGIHSQLLYRSCLAKTLEIPNFGDAFASDSG